MQTILFLKGLPASGKSTFAKQLCENNKEFRRINKDDIREELGNPPFSNAFEKDVLNIERRRGLEYLDQGFSIIVDDTNFSEKHSNYWKEIASMRHIEFLEKFFDTAVETCIERDQQREKSVGKGVILNMYNNYLNSKDL